jgi:hypothetical protein
MAKNTTVAENGIQGSFVPVTENIPAARPGNSIHLSLQGKGGVGKSLIASILAQYFADRRREIQCIDTDPVNRTLFQYKALNVSRLELLRDGSLDQRGFDDLMERLLTEDATFVVDNGASTFLPLWRPGTSRHSPRLQEPRRQHVGTKHHRLAQRVFREDRTGRQAV